MLQLYYVRHRRVSALWHITYAESPPESDRRYILQRELPNALCGHDFNAPKGKKSTYHRNDGVDVVPHAMRERVCEKCAKREAARNPQPATE